MAEPDQGLDAAVPEWVTLQEAAKIGNVSEKTMRRRVTSGQVEHKTEGGRYMVRTASIMPEPAGGRELIPLAFLDRLEALRSELQSEAVARARAEEIATFQAERAALEIERRRELETERDSLQQELQRLKTRHWWQRVKRP